MARQTEKDRNDAAEGDTEVTAETVTITAPVVTEEVLTYPNWGPPAPDEAQVISLHQLQLAEFHGEEPEPNSQAHLERFEEFLRSHAIGGSNRKSEGFYGPKTRELVDAAYQHYLGKDGHGRVGADLIEALRQAGAVVSG